jgi:5-methylthioadenosine/S-adenosylhomocysteine deaminase
VLAEEIDTHIQIHLQESAAEVADSVRDHGVSPIERLHRLGVLGPRTQAVHLTQFNERDIELLAQSNTSAVHCPASNAKLASGYSAIKQLLAAGLHVGLGTDGAASNNTLDLFDSARLAALQAKLHSSDATALNATQSLHLATQGGANALGLGEQIGSLSIGKQADIIAIDTHQPGMQPVHNPISQLIYTQAGSAVNHVWIDGQAVVRSRELLNIDLAELLANTKAWRDKLAKR